MEKERKEKAEVRQGDMTEGPILKQLIMFALPLFIGALFQLMYNMTDSIILGKFVGADALAAIGATNTTTFGLLQIAVGVTNAFTVVLSHQFGAKQEERMKKNGIQFLVDYYSDECFAGGGFFFWSKAVDEVVGNSERYCGTVCDLYSNLWRFDCRSVIL